MNIFVAGYEQDSLDNVKREAAAWADFYGSGLAIGAFGRRGTNALKLRGGQTVDYALPGTPTELFIGLALWQNDAADTGTADGEFLRLYDSSNAGRYISAYVNAGRRLALLVNNGGSITWTSTTPIAAAAHYHIGLHVKTHATTGILGGYLGGNPTPDVAEATGQTGAAGWVLDTMRVRGPGSTNSASKYNVFGDIYVNDSLNTDGLGHNVLWGDMKVVGKKVANGNGANNGLTRSTGADSGALLNDASDATYLSGLAGTTTCATTALGFNASAIKTRAVKMIADKEDATARTLDLTTRVGGVDYLHSAETGNAAKPLEAANKRRYVFLQPLNPATAAAWASVAAIDATEIGPTIA